MNCIICKLNVVLASLLSAFSMAASAQEAAHQHDSHGAAKPASKPAKNSDAKGMEDMKGMDSGTSQGTAQPSRRAPAAGDHGAHGAVSAPKASDDMKGMDMSTTSSETGSHSGHGGGAAPPVGSLPRSDGSSGKPLSAYGIVNDMEDNPRVSMFVLDQFEYFRDRNDDGLAWDARFRYGRDINRLWVRSEGERVNGKTDADVEAFWGRAVAPFWDALFGVRHDFGSGPKREWAAFGVQGLAPYRFNVEATGYLGQSGRTAARLKAEYDLLLTQRWIFTPEFEANFYGKNDRARDVGSGLSDAALSFRLRYEIRREIAPYIGVSWGRKFGKTAEFARDDDEPVSDRRIMAGIRLWF